MHNHNEQYDEVSGAALVSNLWQYAAIVFYPILPQPPIVVLLNLSSVL